MEENGELIEVATISRRFSQGTLHILRELLTTFGDFYSKLRNCFEMDKIPLEKCCSGDEYGPALNRVRELAKWIKEQPCSKVSAMIIAVAEHVMKGVINEGKHSQSNFLSGQAPRQKSGGIVFDEGVVEAIQKHVDTHNETPLQAITIKVCLIKR